MSRTDTERLDFLEEQFGVGVINDDNGHWALSGNGIQNCPMDDDPIDIQTTFWIEKDEWHNSIRDAIDD